MSKAQAAEMLVHEMGFNRAEVDMALEDTSGDVEQAIQKLLSGDYRPPAYSALESQPESVIEEKKSDLYPNMSNAFSNFWNRSKAPKTKAEEASAPPLFNSIVAVPDEDLSPEHLPKLTSLPPPYKKLEKENKFKDWEVHMNVTYMDYANTSLPVHSQSDTFTPLPGKDERCAVCFNPVITDDGSQQVLKHEGKIFHRSCFSKKHGPKCAYCCFPLSQPDKDHELSGKYLVYKKKDYHVECYEKYAGPRCNYCFNVIIEKPNGEFSGNWVVDKKEQYHVECMRRKMYAIYRAKHS